MTPRHQYAEFPKYIFWESIFSYENLYLREYEAKPQKVAAIVYGIFAESINIEKIKISVTLPCLFKET